MKIAIFHNLEKGGALNMLLETTKILYKNNTIHIYSHNNNIPPNYADKFFIYKINKTNNIIEHLYQVVFKLNNLQKYISKKIKKGKYDLILIYPCQLTQSPYVLHYLGKLKNLIYIFTEPKREFYEQTSFDHFSFRRTLARYIRLPIKYVDRKNCQSADNIVAISYYISDQIKNIYNKKSFVVYPSLIKIKSKKITIKNNFKCLSVGTLSKIKGHDFTLRQMLDTNIKFTILGQKCHDSQKLINLVKDNPNIKRTKTENEKTKTRLFRQNSIYLANQNHEPFGISTLEATNNNCFVLGKNEGGTSEIISHGLNGYLYSSNQEQARKILLKYFSQLQISFYKTCKIDWRGTTFNLLSLYHYFTHTPNE